MKKNDYWSSLNHHEKNISYVLAPQISPLVKFWWEMFLFLVIKCHFCIIITIATTAVIIIFIITFASGPCLHIYIYKIRCVSQNIH